MDDTEAFYDYCIPYNKDDKVLREICQELVDLGYKTIAIEQQFDHTKKDNVKRTDIIPSPYNLQWLKDEFQNRLKILQRLTITFEDCNIGHAMGNSINLKKFNIIAGQPKTEATFTHACTTFNGDIITLHPQDGAKYFINRKAYQVAVKRDVFFEIKYAWCIKNSTYRKDIIKLAHNYFTRGKSRNIILSSGATNAFELRSPCDVANMSFIFSLSEDQGKCAINRFGRRLFLRAESRRLGKTIMFVKASGPVAFSDTSSDDDNDDDDDNDNDTNADDNEINIKRKLTIATEEVNVKALQSSEIPAKKQRKC